MSDKKIYLGKVIQNLQSAPASNSSSFVDKTPRDSSDKVARENKNVEKSKVQQILDDLFSPFLNGTIGTNISEDTWKSIFGESTTTKTTPYASSLKTNGPISYKPDSTSVPNRDYLPNYNPETMAVKGSNEIIPNYYEDPIQRYLPAPQCWEKPFYLEESIWRGCEFCAHEHVYGKWMEFHHDGDSSESVEIPAKFCPNCGRRLEK